MSSSGAAHCVDLSARVGGCESALRRVLDLLNSQLDALSASAPPIPIEGSIREEVDAGVTVVSRRS